MDKGKHCILVGIDFGKPSLTAIEQTFNLARLLKIGITLLYVIEENDFLKRFFSQRYENESELIRSIEIDLNALKHEIEGRSGIKVNTVIGKGKPHDVILKKAEELNAVMIFMGTTNSDEKIVGTTAHKVVRTAKCPVITVRAETYHDGCRTILLPLDLTAQTRQKIAWAIEIARLYAANIKIISVLSSTDDETRQNLNIQLKQARNFIELSQISCSAELIEKSPNDANQAQVILRYIDQHPEIDLIVIMTQPEEGVVNYFLDAEAQQIIRSASVHVMSVVPYEFSYPSKWLGE